MIELTDEQKQEIYNITKMVLVWSELEMCGNDFLNLLTLPQIKHLAEQHNADVIEWVEFDAEDESTWPDETKVLLAINNESEQSTICVFSRNLAVNFGEHYSKWAYLPQPKEK